MRLGKGNINDVKFSQDGTLLAVATGIGVWLYDAHTGAEIYYSTTNPKTSKQSPFHRMVERLLLAVGARADAIQLWDIDTGPRQVSAMGKGIGSLAC